MATRQREKAEKLAKERDKRPTCIARYIRIPSDKVGIVLDLIRGKKYEDAVAILRNTPKSASPVVLKILNSAAANAENNLNMSKDTLFVAECWAMAGPTLKRMMPRARGRADRILKRTSHIRVILDEIKVKSEGKVTVKSTAKKDTKAGKQTNDMPVSGAERPLTDTPNNKKPLGEKKVAPKTAPAKTAKPATKPATKPAVKKPAPAKKEVK